MDSNFNFYVVFLNLLWVPSAETKNVNDLRHLQLWYGLCHLVVLFNYSSNISNAEKFITTDNFQDAIFFKLKCHIFQKVAK